MDFMRALGVSRDEHQCPQSAKHGLIVRRHEAVAVRGRRQSGRSNRDVVPASAVNSGSVLHSLAFASMHMKACLQPLVRVPF